MNLKTAVPFYSHGFRIFKFGTRGIPTAGFRALTEAVFGQRSAPSRSSKFVPLLASEFVANSFQEAGPVFVKIGQILASRDDILPVSLCTSLAKLYDKQKPVPFKKIQKMLTESYENWPFKQIEPVALGVGSVGQVHRAILLDGTEVVVKCIKPGVENAARADLALLKILFQVLQKAAPTSYQQSFILMERSLTDLSQAIEGEFDLEKECLNFLNFKERCRKNPAIYVPDSYPSLSRKNILVMEYLEGKSLGEIGQSKINRETSDESTTHLASIVLRELLEQIFEDGTFHADPHGGNLLLLKDGRVALIDLGLTGEMTTEARNNIVEAIRAIVAGHPKRAMDTLLRFALVPENFDKDSFKEAVEKVYREQNKNGIKLESLVQELFKEAYAAGLYLPPSTTLLIKSMVTIEGVARSLDPSINLKGTAIGVFARSSVRNFFRQFTG